MADNNMEVRLTALGESFTSGINDALGTWNDFMGKLGSSPATFAGVATAGTALVGALFGLAKSTADYGDHLLELHDKSGASVEDLSLLKYAAEQSNTSIDALANGIKFMQKSMTEATTGNQGTILSFQALGLSISELQNLDPTSQFLSIADAIKDVEDPAMRTKLAIDIFGRSGADLLPLMMQGKAGITDLMAEAEKLGLKMSIETAKQSDEFNDSLSKLWTVIKQVGMDIGALLIPVFQKFFEWLSLAVSFTKSNVIVVFDTLRLVFDLLAAGVLTVVKGFAKLTDAIGLTKGAVEQVDKWLQSVYDTAEDSASKLASSFNTSLDIITNTANAQSNLNKETKEHTKLTNEQRQAILNKANAEKEAAEAAKKAEDAEKERLKAVKQSIQDYIRYLQNEMDSKYALKQFDDTYFEDYATLLRIQGKTEEEVDESVAKKKKELKNQEKKDFIDINKLEETAVKGVASAVKSIWSKNKKDLDDVWRDGLDTFVDVMAEMVIQSMVAGKAIQVEMAAATAGVTLLIGAISTAFGSSSSSTSAIAEATTEFLDNLESTLQEFEDRVLDTMEKLQDATGTGSQAYDDLVSLFSRYQTAIAGFWDAFANMDVNSMFRWAGEIDSIGQDLVDNLDETKQAILDRYDLEESLINDVFDLLQQKADFVKSMESDITDVARTFYSDQEMYDALSQDIVDLWSSLTSTSDQEDQLTIIEDLRSAYSDLWTTAQSLYAGDTSALAGIQQQIIAGLQEAEAAGTSAYDSLIDINLEMLGVQQTQADLEAQMTNLLTDIQNATLASFDVLDSIASGIGAGEDITSLLSILGVLLSTLGFDVPAMGSGGVAMSPTMALIGESGPEAVIPLDKAGGFGGGNTFNLSFPNVKSLNDITPGQAETLLKGSFRIAAEKLGRSGYYWAMPTR